MTNENDVPVEDKALRDYAADDIKAPFERRRTRAQERAQHKVTADEILAKRALKASKAQDPDSPAARKRRETRGSRMRIGTGVVLLVATGICVSAATGVANQSQRDQAVNEALIEQMAAEAGESPSGDDTEVTGTDQVTPAQVQAHLDQVRAVGGEVAASQDQFDTLLAANPDESGNGAPSQGFLDGVEHREDLVQYFDAGTYLLADDEIYSPSSLFALGTDEIDPRTQWYERASGLGSNAWSVAAVLVSDSGDSSRVDVTWLNQDTETSDLLAWATGTWSDDAGAFISLTVGTTAVGDQQNALTSVTTGE